MRWTGVASLAAHNHPVGYRTERAFRFTSINSLKPNRATIVRYVKPGRTSSQPVVPQHTGSHSVQTHETPHGIDHFAQRKTHRMNSVLDGVSLPQLVAPTRTPVPRQLDQAADDRYQPRELDSNRKQLLQILDLPFVLARKLSTVVSPAKERCRRPNLPLTHAADELPQLRARIRLKNKRVRETHLTGGIQRDGLEIIVHRAVWQTDHVRAQDVDARITQCVARADDTSLASCSGS